MHNKLLSVNKILSVFRISKSSLYGWLKDGVHETCRMSKITEPIKTYILGYIDKYPNFNIPKIIKQLYNKYQINIKKSTIYHLIKINGYKKKRLI